MIKKFSLALSLKLALAVQVTIHNDQPRYDNTGVIMDAHDCSIRVLPDGTYVMVNKGCVCV